MFNRMTDYDRWLTTEPQERIDEAEVIRLTERRNQALAQKRAAEEHLRHCSPETEKTWLEMLEDAEEVLAALDNPADID